MYMCVYVIYISEWVVDDLRKKTEFYKISYFNSITQEFYKEVMKENIKTVKMSNID